MKILSHSDTLEILAKATKKPCLYLNLEDHWGYKDPGKFFNELLKAAPYLNLKDHGQAILDGCAFIVCEDEAELSRLYYQTVGDDGPTKTNKYRGKVRVYALTCDANGELQNENT